MADNFNISDVPEGAGPKSVEVPGDIADGTAGELLTWDAAGVAAVVATGAAAEVLTSNGAGAAPTFQMTGGAPVASVFGRVGAVAAVAGDYVASEVGNDSNIDGTFVDDALNNLDNAALQMIRTTAFTLPTVFGDIELDDIDIETNSLIIDGEAGTPDRVTLEVAGVFEINYHFEVGPSSDVGSSARVEARVRVNDTTVLPGSLQYTTIHNDNSLEGQNHVDGITCSFLYDATAADFITLQAQMVILAGTPDPDLLADTVVMTVKRITQ